MPKLAELGIAKRLFLIVAAGAVALAALTAISVTSQNRLVDQGWTIDRYQSSLAALNHLNTRQSELKVDAYRSALGQDVTQDVKDDVQSATEAADAVEAAGMPDDMAATFAADRPAFVDFNAFITHITNRARH